MLNKVSVLLLGVVLIVSGCGGSDKYILKSLLT